MAGRGGNTVPRPPGQRRQADRSGAIWSTLHPDGEIRGPELPEDALLAGEHWHLRTRAWWQTWRESPQAQMFTDTDWDFLIDTAKMHHDYWNGRREAAAELRLRVGKFGATPEDRLRLRLTIDTPATPEYPSDEDSAEDRRSGMRIV